LAQTTYPFAVTVEKEAGGHRVVARNDGPAPVSVMVTFPLTVNVAADRPVPVFAVVPPNGGTLYLARLSPVLSGASSSFKTTSNWILGDMNARPDGTPYRLPFPDGLSFRIGQAPGGPITTHTTPDSRFAVDIGMPEGTPIVAARAGVVMQTKADQVAGAPDPRLADRANDVEILHEDGTIAVYAHLAPGGVRVYPGQRVVAGSIIGLSGSTGYSSGPHLHFAVQRVTRDGATLGRESLPFQFYVGTPPASFAPIFGQVARADYSAPGEVPGVQAQGPAGSQMASALPRVYLEIPAPMMAAILTVQAWQWLAGLAGVVIAIMLVSNLRYAQQRKRLDRLRREEPRIWR
jgi:murein DD-endopeptidase MepM/ murein hydrolase activator NlpD